MRRLMLLGALVALLIGCGHKTTGKRPKPIDSDDMPIKVADNNGGGGPLGPFKHIPFADIPHFFVSQPKLTRDWFFGLKGHYAAEDSGDYFTPYIEIDYPTPCSIAVGKNNAFKARFHDRVDEDALYLSSSNKGSNNQGNSYSIKMRFSSMSSLAEDPGSTYLNSVSASDLVFHQLDVTIGKETKVFILDQLPVDPHSPSLVASHVCFHFCKMCKLPQLPDCVPKNP